MTIIFLFFFSFHFHRLSVIAKCSSCAIHRIRTTSTSYVRRSTYQQFSFLVVIPSRSIRSLILFYSCEIGSVELSCKNEYYYCCSVNVTDPMIAYCACSRTPPHIMKTQRNLYKKHKIQIHHLISSMDSYGRMNYHYYYSSNRNSKMKRKNNWLLFQNTHSLPIQSQFIFYVRVSLPRPLFYLCLFLRSSISLSLRIRMANRV